MKESRDGIERFYRSGVSKGNFASHVWVVGQSTSSRKNRDGICGNKNPNDIKMEGSINSFMIGQEISPSSIQTYTFEFPCQSERMLIFHWRNNRTSLNFEQYLFGEGFYPCKSFIYW
jgi:hypothetical protein